MGIVGGEEGRVVDGGGGEEGTGVEFESSPDPFAVTGGGGVCWEVESRERCDGNLFGSTAKGGCCQCRASGCQTTQHGE